jgi:hypothetical protein
MPFFSTVIDHGIKFSQELSMGKHVFWHLCFGILQVVPGSRPHPANIGELFSEGSLNPYAEDPYAFD